MDFLGWVGGKVHFNQIKILIKNNNKKKCLTASSLHESLEH